MDSYFSTFLYFYGRPAQQMYIFTLWFLSFYCKCRTQKSRQKSPSGHRRTNLSGYIFATKARIDNRKTNLLSSNISSTCPHNQWYFSNYN